MGYMAFYVSLFYFLIAQIAMKNEDRQFEFSADYMHRNDMPSVHSRTFRSARSSGRLSKFFLFSPKDTKSGSTLDVQDRQSLSTFDPSLGTMMIIHGFLDSVAIAHWMHDMKDELLTYGDYNVIVVDWSSGNSIPYSRAAANTKRVGQEISELLKILIDNGAKPETFHLIGHSMGSHIAGFVGENIKGIGRITGLDPAGPHFENGDPSKRLDPSDAQFVDVIHTDAGGIGMVEETGHQDFYPNGGSEQPGCTASNTIRALIQEGVIEGVRNLICSHMIAVLFFTASINNRNCDMTGTMCNSWEEFKHGKCSGCGSSGERCALMGFHAEQSTGRNKSQSYYLLTRPNEPYCAYEYLITFEVERNGRSRGGLLGLRISDLPVIGDKTLQLTVHGSHGTSEFSIDDNRFDSRSELLTYVVPSEKYLGTVDTAVIEWITDTAVTEWIQRKGARVLTVVTGRRIKTPSIKKIEIAPVKDKFMTSRPEKYVLCSRETVKGLDEKSTFRNSYC